MDPRACIQAMVDRETRAWDEQDAAALVELFHPDMVWPWPPTAQDHDPATWIWGMGRYDRERWMLSWQALFDAHELVHNRRATVRIEVTPEGDGGFAVVDVDTLWRNRATGADFPWKGRACKVYAKVGGDWKMTMHTGLLEH